MRLISSQESAMLLILSTSVLAAVSSSAELAMQSPLWKRSISHVYVCSENNSISAIDLETFYAAVPQVSAKFSDGWDKPGDQQTHIGDIVIVSIAPQGFSPNLKECLKGLNLFQEQWMEDIAQQAREVGTVPEYLANTPSGKYIEPLNAFWIYRYGEGVAFSSYIYQSEEHFSYGYAVKGALQFKDPS